MELVTASPCPALTTFIDADADADAFGAFGCAELFKFFTFL